MIGSAATTITPATKTFSAGKGGPAEKVSVKRRKVSATPKPKRSKPLTLAETLPGLQVNVDDDMLFAHVSAGKVGVHKNGSRQKKHGTAYDYRSHYRALRLNSGSREVLAFGTPENLAQKLAQIGVHVCFDHKRPNLTVGERCRECGAGNWLASGMRA